MANFSFYKIKITTLLFMLMSMLLLLPACHRNKKIKKTDEIVSVPIKPIAPTPTIPTPIKIDAAVSSLLAKVNNNEIVFKELALKLKTKVTSPDLNQSFTTNIRWKKNEKIWLSMSIIGIEGARVLITRDSIQIMDKINNRYILKPIDYIREKTFVQLSFDDIEQLLLGQMLFAEAAEVSYAANATNHTLSFDGGRFLSHLIFDKSSAHLSGQYITDKMYMQTLSSQYQNYQPQLGKQFPMDRELKMSSGVSTFEMIAKFQSIEIKENLEYPFYINPAFTIEK